MNQQRYPMPMREKDRGFTLIEILVVIGVVGILLGIAIPAYNGYIEKGQIAEALQVLKDIERAIIALGTDTGEWPGHNDIGEQDGNEIWDLNAATAGLVEQDTGTPYTNWNGPYITSVPKDPWGMDYYMDLDYDSNGDSIRDAVAIASFGPDKCCPSSYDDNNVVIILPLK